MISSFSRSNRQPAQSFESTSRFSCFRSKRDDGDTNCPHDLHAISQVGRSSAVNLPLTISQHAGIESKPTGPKSRHEANRLLWHWGTSSAFPSSSVALIRDNGRTERRNACGPPQTTFGAKIMTRNGNILGHLRRFCCKRGFVRSPKSASRKQGHARPHGDNCSVTISRPPASYTKDQLRDWESTAVSMPPLNTKPRVGISLASYCPGIHISASASQLPRAHVTTGPTRDHTIRRPLSSTLTKELDDPRPRPFSSSWMTSFVADYSIR